MSTVNSGSQTPRYEHMCRRGIWLAREKLIGSRAEVRILKAGVGDILKNATQFFAG